MNAKGRQERIGAIATEALGRIEKLTDTKRQELDQDLARARTRLPDRLPEPTADAASPTILFLKRQEIRQFLARMTVADREAAVKSAPENNDLDLLLAIQDAPALQPLVSKDVFQTAKERYYEVNRPEQVKELDTARSARSLHEYNAKLASRLVAEGAGVVLKREGLKQADIQTLVPSVA